MIRRNAPPNSHQNRREPMSASASVFSQSFFHGTRADMKPGDLIVVGHQSNFTDEKQLSWVYCAGTLDAAIWGAELASGNGRERIYVVEPTGTIVDDPNLTDKKFPGNPTLSYRSRDPLRVIAEVTNWQGHSPEQLQKMRDGIARSKSEGADKIID
jgi:Rifampin ADP-ribosyl transferase